MSSGKMAKKDSKSERLESTCAKTEAGGHVFFRLGESRLTITIRDKDYEMSNEAVIESKDFPAVRKFFIDLPLGGQFADILESKLQPRQPKFPGKLEIGKAQR